MSIRLFVDDIRLPYDDSWHLAKTITEAIRILDTMIVEEVSLDHDIAVQTRKGGAPLYVPAYIASGETFEPVFRFIHNFRLLHNGPIYLKRVIIHTANPAAAQKMKNLLLEDWGEEYPCPFEVVVKPAEIDLQDDLEG